MTAFPRPRHVAVVGGTHGNEKSGVWTIRAMRSQPDRFRRNGLRVESLLANPEAEARNLRYLDRDLNRCFGPELEAPSDGLIALERRRAREIRDALGVPDLVVDIHNTTSAMGITWILTDENPWVWWLASQAIGHDDRVRILRTPETPATNVFLPSLGRGEITLEIGAVAHGTHSHWAAQAAISQVEWILDRLAGIEDDFDPIPVLRSADFPYFLGQPSVDYPRDSEGRISATIHEGFLGRDYQPVAAGAPLFHDPVHRRDILHAGPTFHPVFVGEAAYVEKGIAYTPTLLRSWNGGTEVLP